MQLEHYLKGLLGYINVPNAEYGGTITRAAARIREFVKQDAAAQWKADSESAMQRRAEQNKPHYG